MQFDDEYLSGELKIDELVKIVGLVNAKELNGKIGRLVTNPQENGRIGVRLVDHEKPKSIKVENVEWVDIHRHFHYEDKDIPELAFNGPNGEEVQMRIENGAGKTCVECGRDLDNVYHVKYNGEWMCEEHYVQNNASSMFNRCALCLDYVPFRLAKPLPKGLMDGVYPGGMLPNGDRIATERGEDKMVFWAHTSCLSCHLCGTAMYVPQLNPHGFVTKKMEKDSSPPVIFLCKGPPGATSYCDQRFLNIEASRKRLQQLESFQVQDLVSILKDRQVRFDESREEKDSLVRKVIVTDKKRGNKVAHIVTKSVADDTPGSFANHSNGCGCGCEASRVVTRAAPGADLVDLRCSHGCPYVLKYWDDKQRRSKRDAVNEFMMATFPLFVSMSDEQCKIRYPAFPGTAFQFACLMTMDFWKTDGKEVLLNDIEEKFIPSFLWNIAVTSMVKDSGSYGYASGCLATSIIASALLELHKKHGTWKDQHLRRLLTSGNRFEQLKEIEKGEVELIAFMNSSMHKRCECMQYVATAAEIGVLSLKPHKVKAARVKCAVCDEFLADPKYCSRCEEVAYCGRLHQQQHWKTHKKKCNKQKKKDGK